MNNFFIVDVGSSHISNLSRCLEAITRLSDVGVTKVKFQLFPPSMSAHGNYCLPYEWMPQIMDYAKKHNVSCSASVWDTAGVDILLQSGATWIKIAYSQRNNKVLMDYISKHSIMDLIVTSDIWTELPDGAKRLFVDGSKDGAYYPAYNEIDFSGMFPLFDGYSCHTLGIRMPQIAVRSGAHIIEVHGNPLNRTNCNDDKFAWDLAQIKRFVEFLKWN